MLKLIDKEPLRVGACAEFPYSEALHEDLEYESRFGDDVFLGRISEDGKTLYVPREIAAPDKWKGNENIDFRSWGPKIKPFAINCKFPPRNKEQERVITESINLFNVDDLSHIIEASTGFGKTYIGIAIAAYFGLKTLIVVNKEDSLAGWRDDLLKFTNLTPDDIGVIQQDKTQIKGKVVCIGMVHTLAKMKEAHKNIYREFGLTIFDEVHHMAAETFSIVAGLFESRLRLGLSATPKRIDGKEFVFHAHIGPVGVTAKLIPVPPKILVEFSNFKLPRVKATDPITGQLLVDEKGMPVYKPMDHEPGKTMHIAKMLARNPERNSIIVNFTKACFDAGRYTLVLSDLINHLERLYMLLHAAGVPKDELAFYIGGMKEKELEQSITKKVVLGTYGFTAEATDVPWWSALVLATPRAHVKQAIGRVLREYPNKPKPVVMDIVDGDSWVFLQYYQRRLETYVNDEIKATIAVID